ncbi:MAG: hypothetical protein COT28_05605 [Methylobacterium sp. CG08_land_8_20_14_0_20_71_15]|nr:MAG: hypothetical protein COT28_05605 [Methylobacterium sp. CG08_land_8_20_14_0_20_71_15]
MAALPLDETHRDGARSSADAGDIDRRKAGTRNRQELAQDRARHELDLRLVVRLCRGEDRLHPREPGLAEEPVEPGPLRL